MFKKLKSIFRSEIDHHSIFNFSYKKNNNEVFEKYHIKKFTRYITSSSYNCLIKIQVGHIEEYPNFNEECTTRVPYPSSKECYMKGFSVQLVNSFSSKPTLSCGFTLMSL